MAELKDKATWGIGGVVLAGILQTGIFALKSDVSALEAKVYRDMVTKEEYTQAIERLDNKLDKVLDLLYKEKHK